MYKVAFVSGASRGIGRAIATSLAKEGYHLGLVCRKNQKMLEDLAEDLRSVYHIEVLTFTGDVGDPSFVKALAEEMLAHFSQIDVLVNNAGISHIGLLTDMSVEEWDQILSVNLSSCFYTAKAFVPAMVQKQSGRIINISSMWGNVGASCEIAYSASKGGIHAFTKALAKEVAASNIQVNAIAFGMIDTEMNAECHRYRHERLPKRRRTYRPGGRNSSRPLCPAGRSRRGCTASDKDADLSDRAGHFHGWRIYLNRSWRFAFPLCVM